MKREIYLKTFLVASIFTFFATTSTIAKDAPDFKAAVNDKMTFAPTGSVELHGILGKSLSTSYFGDIMSWDIDDLLKPFQTRPEDKMWQIEFWGKWYTSAQLAYDFKPSALLDKRLKYAASGLIATQSDDGQITSYAKGKEFGTWDIWGRKYVMLGLLAEYNRTNDTKVLDAVKKHADCIMKRLSTDKRNICDIGMWSGMASSSILEPFTQLYRATNDKKYLDFCEFIVASWSNSKSNPDLLNKALAEKNVFDMFGKPDYSKKGYGAGGASKSYEMMSCYEGLLELHRITGKPEYKKAVENLVRNVRDTEITVLGSGSIWERWCFGKFIQQCKIEHWMETCVTVTWIKICAQMFRLTGDPAYLDDIELAAYNALIAAQMADGKWWAHYSPMNGKRSPAPEQCNMHMNCCVASGPRGLFLIPKLAYSTTENGVCVNLYEAGNATLQSPKGKVKLNVSGANFVENGNTSIKLSNLPPKGNTFEIALRIPRWSKNTMVNINGVPVQNIKAGQFLKLMRNWKNDDSIEISFDMSTRISQDPANSKMLAIERGPFVFALDKKFDKEFNKPFTPKTNPDGSAIATLSKNNDAHISLDVQSINGSTRKFIDYPSAGQTWNDDSQFQVWFKSE